MGRIRRLRPSPAMLVALLALFVALGGPAQAARMITGKDVKNHSLTTKDLSKKAVKTLQSTPRGSVKERALAIGAVSSGKLRDSAVTAGKIALGSVDSLRMAPNAIGPRELMSGGVVTPAIADSAVTGPKIADGSLDSRDVARFSGTFSVRVADIGTIAPHACWSGEPTRVLSPDVDIRGDLVLVTPDAAWPEQQLAFTVRNSADASRFVLAACNVTDDPFTWPDENGLIGFRYMVVDIP